MNIKVWPVDVVNSDLHVVKDSKKLFKCHLALSGFLRQGSYGEGIFGAEKKIGVRNRYRWYKLTCKRKLGTLKVRLKNYIKTLKLF
jgi:hypothetical protein